MCPDPGWTSLEIAKLAVGALTPVAVAAFAFFVDRRLRRVEAVRSANQTVVARRVQLFDAVAPKLNRLLCFGTFVGRWKEITPADAVALKRDLDETMYANRPLFSDALFAAYRAFMATMFDMHARVDADAPLRVPLRVRGDRRNLDWWDDSMTALFSADRPATAAEVQAAYDELSERFRADLYVTGTAAVLPVPPP